jgi:hypothetical protein
MAAEIMYGKNHQAAYVDFPATKFGIGEMNGKVHVAYDSFTVDTAVHGQYEVGDVIKAMKIPFKAKVLDVIVSGPSQGTTGIFECGWDTLPSGVAGDSDGFIDAIDLGGQAATKSIHGELNAPGMFKDFAEEAQVILTCTEASDTATGTISVAVIYAMH